MVSFDVVFMALISAAIVAFLMWSICTQHSHYGCADPPYPPLSTDQRETCRAGPE